MHGPYGQLGATTFLEEPNQTPSKSFIKVCNMQWITIWAVPVIPWSLTFKIFLDGVYKFFVMHPGIAKQVNFAIITCMNHSILAGFMSLETQSSISSETAVLMFALDQCSARRLKVDAM